METIILVNNTACGYKIHSYIMDYYHIDIPIFTKDQILKSITEISNVRYIFSTWYMPQFSKKEIKEIFKSLQAIFYCAGTIKYFANPFFDNGIRIFSAVSANAIPVAEFTSAQIILANKGYFQSQVANRGILWKLTFKNARRMAESKVGNYNAKIGILGCGNVGKAIIGLLSHYRFKIFVYDPYLPEEIAKDLGVIKENMKFIFSNCDVISNHLPNLPELENILNYNLFSLMKSNSTFINTGRGAQVVEADLAKCLRKNQSLCALLDVTSREPLFPWSSLKRCMNAFITPHIAGSISNEICRMVDNMWESYCKVKGGKEAPYEVFKESLIKQA